MLDARAKEYFDFWLVTGLPTLTISNTGHLFSPKKSFDFFYYFLNK